MGKKIQNNTFTGGMNLDIDKSMLKNNQYLDTENFRLILNDDGKSGVLSNIRDEILKLDLPSSATYRGHAFIRDYLVIFSYITAPAIVDFINIISLEDITSDNTVITLSYTNYYYDDAGYDPDAPDFADVDLTTNNLVLKVEDEYLFEYSTDIKIISRYETPFIQKIYWVDGINEVKHLNIIDSDYNSLSDIESDVSKLNLFPNVEFASSSDNFELVDVVGGQLLSGRVQYAYQLYDLYGAETTFSEPSGLLNITSSSEKSDNDLNYKGENPDVITSKGIKGTFNLGSTNFNKIRIIAIHYSDINSNPTLNIVTELDLEDSVSSITFIDDGNYIDSFTEEEYAVLGQTELIASSIATKNDILFVGNVKENYFDVGNWDARAYRFKIADYDDSVLSGSVTLVSAPTSFQGTFAGTDPELDIGDLVDVTLGVLSDTVEVIAIITPGSVFEFAINSVTPSLTDIIDLLPAKPYALVYNTSEIGSWTAPEATIDGSSPTYPSDLTLDAVNAYNILDNDGLSTYEYIYQTDGTTLGGEGPNITYSIEDTSSIMIDNTADTLSKLLPTPETSPAVKTTFTSNKDSDDISFSAFSGIKQSSTLVTYQRDEIYRFGIVFLDIKGRRSDVKWVGDIRMPNIKDSPITTYSSSTGRTLANLISLSFTVHGDRDGYPTDAVGYQIVRVKRDSINRTIHAQGVISPSQQTTASSGIYQTSLRSSGFGLPTLGFGFVRDLISFISPEISINKNIRLGSKDYIQILNDGIANGVLDTPDTKVKNLNDKIVYGSNDVTTFGSKYSVDQLKLHEFDNLLTYDSTITDVYTYNIGGYTYTPYNKSLDTIVSAGSEVQLNGFAPTHALCKLDSDITDISNDSTAGSILAHTILANYVKDISESIYGGLSYQDRVYNEYIGCDQIYDLDGSANTIFGGDTYIGYFDAPVCMRDDTFPSASSEKESFINLMIPVESSINLNLRGDDSFKNFYADPKATLLQETAGLHTSTIGTQEFSQTEDLFQYNSAYSRQNDTISYLPQQNDFVQSNEFDVRVYNSDIKTNGELTDSWTKFRVNNFIDVDTTYGPLQHLLTNDNRLYFWQDAGFGVLAVNDRSLLQDSDITTLTLGTGGVLERYDYINNKVGTEQWRSILNTNRGLYWYYDNENALYSFTNSLSEISKIKGIQKLFTDLGTELTVVSGYNSKYKEVLFTLRESNTNYYTVVINELMNIPTSLYDIGTPPQIYINHPSVTMISGETTGVISGFNKYDSNNTSFISDSVLRLVVNDNFHITKIFDNLEWYNEALHGATGSPIEATFDTIRCYNSQQDTGVIPLTGDYAANHRLSSYVTTVPRNDETIFSDSPDRIRDKYMIIELTYTDSTRALFVSYLNTKYRTTNFQ